VPLSLSPRMFIGLLGAAAVVAGLIALLTGVTTSIDALFGPQTVGCGSTVAPNHEFGANVAAACEKALDTRRMWGWPLLIVGGIAASGAVLVRRPASALTADAGDEEADTSL
jgi:hypothetical protein